MKKNKRYIAWFKDLTLQDIPAVGGKNAFLGEMFSVLSKKGINIPNGFALTSEAYWYFLETNKLKVKLENLIKQVNYKDLKNVQRVGARARKLICASVFPKDLEAEIIAAYKELSKQYKESNTDVAVRSSSVAEDVPTESSTGAPKGISLFETYLNINNTAGLLKSIKNCFASNFNDRVIVYRKEKKIAHLDFALPVGVQKMVRSDLASSGIIFTLDMETGFRDVVLIDAIWGVGKMIVKGRITPDEFYVFKPTLAQGFKPVILKNLGRKDKKYIYTSGSGLKEVKVPVADQLKFSLQEEEVLQLAKWAVIIEKHYKRAQDIEWAKDGKTGELFIVQARPETVRSEDKIGAYQEYKLVTNQKPILTGIAVGNKIGQGKVRAISDLTNITKFKKGEVLVTKTTDPDWVSIFPLASAIITEEGGKTCHAAIVSRELGVPAIVGVKDAMQVLRNGQAVTVDCATGLGGRVFNGKIPFQVKNYNLKEMPRLKTKIMLNMGVPEMAFKASFLPNDGVGLARQEFIVAEKVKIHPLALYYFAKLKDKSLKHKITELTVGYQDKREYFIEKLAEGIALIAAAFYPKEVILRFSDFKTNEYRNLIGGDLFEKEEENPMLGFRGACRYLDPEFLPVFKMECQAIARCRKVFGLDNISLMVPFCRTPEEGRQVKALIEKLGLKKVKVYVMAEIPTNVILADEFLDVFDGMSIGSNDLTQLVLGLDRDNAKIAYIGDERNLAVKRMIKEVIKTCRRRHKYCGICGQAPSDYTEFAEFLIQEGITSISLNPDTVIKTILTISKKQ